MQIMRLLLSVSTHSNSMSVGKVQHPSNFMVVGVVAVGPDSMLDCGAPIRVLHREVLANPFGNPSLWYWVNAHPNISAPVAGLAPNQLL